MIKNIIFDLDGTVYIGKRMIEGANNTIEYLKNNSIKCFFLTNNSSTSKKTYEKKLNNFGINVSSNEIYSSVDVTENFLKKNKAKKIYVVGTKSLKKTLSKNFKVVKNFYKNESVDFVIVGFDKELNYKKIYDASLYIQKGAKLISTNLDVSCPIEDGKYIPDCGAITLMFEESLKVKSIFLGKPSNKMIDLIINNNKLNKEETIIVGDRINTDIKCGIDSKIKTALVLTGESTKNDVKKTNFKIDYILDSIVDLKNLI